MNRDPKYAKQKVNRILLVWNLKPTDPTGNEQVDTLARPKANTPFIEPESVLDISKSSIISWLEEKTPQYCHSLPGSNMFIPSVSIPQKLSELHQKALSRAFYRSLATKRPHQQNWPSSVYRVPAVHG